MPWHSLESVQNFPESEALRSQVLGLSGIGKPSVVQEPPLAMHSDSVWGMTGLATGTRTAGCAQPAKTRHRAVIFMNCQESMQ